MQGGHIKIKRSGLHIFDFNSKYQKLIYLQVKSALNMSLAGLSISVYPAL